MPQRGARAPEDGGKGGGAQLNARPGEGAAPSTARGDAEGAERAEMAACAAPVLDGAKLLPLFDALERAGKGGQGEGGSLGSLSQRELVARRKDRATALCKVYEEEYWALMELLRAEHTNFVARGGVAAVNGAAPHAAAAAAAAGAACATGGAGTVHDEFREYKRRRRELARQDGAGAGVAQDRAAVGGARGAKPQANGAAATACDGEGVTAAAAAAADGDADEDGVESAQPPPCFAEVEEMILLAAQTRQGEQQQGEPQQQGVGAGTEAGAKDTGKAAPPPAEARAGVVPSVLSLDWCDSEATRRRLQKTLVLADNAAESATVRAAGGALAVILTEHHAFPVKGVEAVIGRATREIPCEVNLALEDPAKATKLSRTAAVLSYDARADTYTIANTGRRPLSVNGREVAIGARCELKSGALLTLAKIPCLFVAHPQAARVAEGRASREDAQRNWPQPGGAYRGHGGRGAW